MITYLYLSLGEFAPLLMRPSLVNSYRASLVEIEGELITKYVVIIIIRETTTWCVQRVCGGGGCVVVGRSGWLISRRLLSADCWGPVR